MIVYNNNSTSKVFYSGFTITKIYACGGELVWSESPFTFKAQYTLNDATSGEVVCNGSSTLTAYEFDDAHNIRNMIVGECVDIWEVPVVNSYTSLRTLDLSHSNITTLPEKFMKGVTTLREVSLNPSTTTISSEAFKSCTSLTAITIPSSVTNIGMNAFESSGLKNLTIKSGVTYSTYVYKGCNSLSSVTIEQGTRMIEQGTFSFCSGLTSVDFPSSIVYLGVQAFMGCRGMEYMIFHSTTPPNLGEDALNLGVNNSCIFYVPCSAMAAYLAHEDWQPFVDRIRPIESDCSYIQYRWTPSGTTCVGFDKYENSIKQVTYNSGTTWQNVSPAEYSATTLIEQDSEDCGYIEPQYRTISTATTCIGNDKHYLDEAQVSLDGGVTWETTATTTGALIEANSYDCGYRTRTVSTAVTCVGVDKYYLQEYQTSTDSGSTWTTVSSTTGSLIEAYSYDCGYRTRETSGSAYCNGVDKYIDVYSEYSEDGGQTWQTASATPTLVESNSYVCGYRTRTLNTATTCVNVDKYTLEEYQVSTDSGSTWTTTGTSATTLIEANSYVCGYRTRTASSATYCDGDDLYVDVYDQVSEDSGSTWTTTATTKTLVEAGACATVAAINYIASSKLDVNKFNFTPTATTETYDSTTSAGTIEFDAHVTAIGNYAFTTKTNLISITIPNGVTSIGESAFLGCSSLSNAIVPNSITSIAQNAFTNCNSLQSITIPSGVTSIGNHTFDGCSSLQSITIPSGVTNIGEYAFTQCRNLQSITIPSGVTSIGERAFSSCSGLISITCYSTNPPTLGEYAFFSTNNAPILVPCESLAAYKTAWSAYESRITCVPSTNFKISANYIGGTNAVADCNTSTTLTFSEIRNLGEGYTAMTSAVVGNCTTTVDSYAFNGDDFRRCKNLSSITFSDSVTSIGQRAFTGNGLREVSCGSGLTSIGEHAFAGNYNLSALTIPNVTTIEEGAFQNCSGLTSLVLPDTLTTIGSNCFNNCKSLTNVHLSNNLTTIGGQSFYGNTSLTSINIPNSVATIGIFAFAGCSAMTAVTIGSGITSIGDSAFNGCSGLTSITINATVPPTIGVFTFDKTNNAPIYVPDASVSAYKAATNWSDLADRIQPIL